MQTVDKSEKNTRFPQYLSFCPCHLNEDNWMYKQIQKRKKNDYSKLMVRDKEGNRIKFDIIGLVLLEHIVLI